MCLTFQSINKFAPRSAPSIFIRYPTKSKGYKCYDPLTSKITISHHVIFNEYYFLYKSSSQPTITSTTWISETHPLLLVTNSIKIQATPSKVQNSSHQSSPKPQHIKILLLICLSPLKHQSYFHPPILHLLSL